MSCERKLFEMKEENIMIRDEVFHSTLDFNMNDNHNASITCVITSAIDNTATDFNISSLSPSTAAPLANLCLAFSLARVQQDVYIGSYHRKSCHSVSVRLL